MESLCLIAQRQADYLGHRKLASPLEWPWFRVDLGGGREQCILNRRMHILTYRQNSFRREQRLVRRRSVGRQVAYPGRFLVLKSLTRRV